MMRILILANADSGLYRFRYELLCELARQGHELVAGLPNGPFVPKLEAVGCRVIETPLNRRGKNPLSELKLLLTYGAIVKETKPDVVLTYTVKPNVYGGIVCRLLGVPYLVNITGLGASIEKGGPLRRLMLALYRTALKRAACVFFQNQDNLMFMARHRVLTQQHRRLIPGSGVNTAQYGLLGYPDGETINFLFIGRIMAEKGIGEYLEAAEEIKARYPNTAFHILGACVEDFEEKLRALIARGVIIYHGVQDDVRLFHKNSHATIHPSYWEGMSNVLLETAACGRPILCSDIGGCREIVDDGVSGFLFERRNSRALIDAVERFLTLDNTERRQMGLNGRARVLKQFDRRLVIAAYIEEIDRIKSETTGRK
ncbi:glycosyltransferase family 4 protein [Oscillospiraceae bacterium CM]|nr:glycosyltransferase family 4 protein [Oscillospiraceae bacterium CM]